MDRESPRPDTSATPFRHSGEEFGIILSGRKDIYLDGELYTLERQFHRFLVGYASLVQKQLRRGMRSNLG